MELFRAGKVRGKNMGNYKFPTIKKQNDNKTYRQVFIRVDDEKTQDAIREAVANSGMSAQKLMLDMIQHCLKEAGFLK